MNLTDRVDKVGDATQSSQAFFLRLYFFDSFSPIEVMSYVASVIIYGVCGMFNSGFDWIELKICFSK